MWGSNILKEQLEKLRKDGIITNDEFDKLSVLCGRAGNMDTYMLKQKSFEEMLTKNFHIKGVYYDKELHNAEGLIAMFPMHCMVKI